MDQKKAFVTSALPYCNNVVHLGNMIGSILSADVYARYLRKKGYDVKFVCGTDDYGTTTEIKALQEKLSCEELCNKYRIKQEEVYGWFNINFDVFGRTSTKIHTELTQEIFSSLHENGLLFEKVTEQYYCETCDRFVCDRFIHGVCYMPNCGGLVKGDECDKCSKMIDLEKVEKKWCSVCSNVPTKKETKHLYFELDPYRKQIDEYFLNRGVKYISPAGKRITKEWLNKDLMERCVSRDLYWGVKLPDLKLSDDYSTKICWPWFDAPIGYISILANSCENWKDYVNPDVNWYQFMAKDNVPFHSIIFPATLIGSKFQNLNCGVTHLCATEYLLNKKDKDDKEGEKFSKSNGVGLFCDQVVNLSKKLGIDEDYWRYYLVKIRPEGADSIFDYEGFCNVIKGELAQKIGNLLNRALAMSKKYYGVNENNKTVLKYDFTNFSSKFEKLKEIVQNYVESFDNFNYHDAVNLINRVAELGNEWINENVVWVACKDGNRDSEYLIGNVVFIMWLFAELAEPIMPNKSKKIKTHCHILGNDHNNMNTFDDIYDILDNPIGKVEVIHDNTELLFKQIKMEDVLSFAQC